MEVLKVFYYKDETFKSFSVSDDTTVSQLCSMFIDKMNYSPKVASYLTLHVVKNGKSVKSLSPSDKPLELQKKFIAAKVKWNDQQKKNYFMFMLNEEGSKRMSLLVRGTSLAEIPPSPPPLPPSKRGVAPPPPSRGAPPNFPPPPSLSNIPPPPINSLPLPLASLPPPPILDSYPLPPPLLSLPPLIGDLPPPPVDLPPPEGEQARKPAGMALMGGLDMEAILSKRGNLKKSAAAVPTIQEGSPPPYPTHSFHS